MTSGSAGAGAGVGDGVGFGVGVGLGAGAAQAATNGTTNIRARQTLPSNINIFFFVISTSPIFLFYSVKVSYLFHF